MRDGDSVKNNWLWTTITKGGEPYEFDSFRVFVWSLRHHRYETAYIERNVVGHYPVQVSERRFGAEFFRRGGRRRRAAVPQDVFVRRLSIRMVNRELDDAGAARRTRRSWRPARPLRPEACSEALLVRQD